MIIKFYMKINEFNIDMLMTVLTWVIMERGVAIVQRHDKKVMIDVVYSCEKKYKFF